MTNTTAPVYTAHTHIARARRLVAVTSSLVALALGTVAVNTAGSAGANPAQSRPTISGTPTATTAAPGVSE
jgi:hypothetical protein